MVYELPKVGMRHELTKRRQNWPCYHQPSLHLLCRICKRTGLSLNSLLCEESMFMTRGYSLSLKPRVGCEDITERLYGVPKKGIHVFHSLARCLFGQLTRRSVSEEYWRERVYLSQDIPVGQPIFPPFGMARIYEFLADHMDATEASQRCTNLLYSM